MIRIALVDDHSLFRRGLRMLLSTHPDFEVVAEASSGEEFLELLPQAQPDVVFMDYSMGALNGSDTTERAIAQLSELKVISLTMYGDNAYYTRMAAAGAKGFLLKDSGFDEVVEAVQTVCSGGTYFSSLLLTSLSQSLRSTQTHTHSIDEQDMLSEREVEVLVGICQGLSTQEIADRMFISKRTVDKHRANILDKSGCKNTASLVVYAIRNGFVEV